VTEIGGDAIDRAAFELEEIAHNPFFCPDAAAAKRWEGRVDAARKAGSSLGAVVECVATGVPAGFPSHRHEYHFRLLGRTASGQSRLWMDLFSGRESQGALAG
jgi:chorismate synthase